MAQVEKLPGTFFGPPTLVDLLRHRAHYQADDIAFTYLVDGENQQVHLTNRQLDRLARAIGAWLQSLDLPGQRALLVYPPGLDFIAAFFGCLYAGVVAVPVYPPRRNRSLARIQAIADDAEARVALTTTVVMRRVEPLIDETPHLKALTWLATDQIPEGMDQRWGAPTISGDTLAFIQYTSGSTGTPKGVVLNHFNLLHNSALIAHAFEHTRSGLGVFWLPSYHDMGLIGGILQPLYVGRPNILMSPMAFLQKPYRWLSAISRFGGTTSGGPNFAYDLCVRKITSEQKATLDLSSWQVAFNGAEPVQYDTLERFAEAFAPCGFRREAFYPCFGLAEATLIVSGGYAKKEPVIRWVHQEALAEGRVIEAAPGQDGARALVGCGGTLPDQTIVIADPQTMTHSPPDRVGEIWVRGPSVAQGYWRQPEATQATFRAYLADTGEGPFLRTGDLGFMRDGELFVTGRIKDLIIWRGSNFYPQDIEKTVQEAHPYLVPNSGAVFTVSADGQERLVVVQELERRKKDNLEAVFQAIRRAVSAEHELPVDAIVLVHAGSIPKTSSGKIQRHACRDGFLNGTLRVVAQWQADQAPAESARPARQAETQAATPTGAEPATAVPAGQAVPSPQQPVLEAPGPVAPSKNGDRQAVGGRSEPTASFARVAELVLQEVRRIAGQRANGLTLDSPITEIGLDSLERMEILASLEERFGGRFPEEVLPQLETCREVVHAVQKYLGSAPRVKPARAPGDEIPPECYRIELFPEYLKLRQNLDFLEQSGIGNPYFTVHQGLTTDRALIDGREVINFSSYNYVGMSGDPVVVEAAQKAAAKYGCSVSASRLVSGEKDLHRQLERALADFLSVEDVVVFVGGHATNETVIGHLFGPGDLILHDSLSHNSILQGSILSGARRRSFPHNDWEAADRILQECRHEYRRVLIVIEGVYSMDGDIPDLPRFIDLKRRHKALLMIDEAHSIGAIGATGRGIGEHFGVDRRDVEIWMGTLSKTFGSCGGFIGGSRQLVEYLKYTAPGFVFSVGLSPPATAAALAACRLLQAEPHRVARLQERARLFLNLAKSHGLNTGHSKDSPVVPVILGNSMRCLELSKALFRRGINVQPILYPAVEESAARLRFFITSTHTEEQIRYTIETMVQELERIDSQYGSEPPAAEAAEPAWRE
ncbi:MAG: aminotransferase class I/II-fold pyridoxal phosphate-dependent enzyme [Thermoguttaceae bacterium]